VGRREGSTSHYPRARVRRTQLAPVLDDDNSDGKSEDDGTDDEQSQKERNPFDPTFTMPLRSPRDPDHSMPKLFLFNFPKHGEPTPSKEPRKMYNYNYNTQLVH
jgi:hypothetical protein